MTPISELLNTLPMWLLLDYHSPIRIAISEYFFPLSCHLACDESASVAGAVGPLETAVAVPFVLVEHALVDLSVGVCMVALAVFLAGPELTCVGCAVFLG